MSKSTFILQAKNFAGLKPAVQRQCHHCHFVMTKEFLKSLQAPSVLSSEMLKYLAWYYFAKHLSSFLYNAYFSGQTSLYFSSAL